MAQLRSMVLECSRRSSDAEHIYCSSWRVLHTDDNFLLRCLSDIRSSRKLIALQSSRIRNECQTDWTVSHCNRIACHRHCDLESSKIRPFAQWGLHRLSNRRMLYAWWRENRQVIFPFSPSLGLLDSQTDTPGI